MSIGRNSGSQSSSGLSSGHTIGYNESGGLSLGMGSNNSSGSSWQSSKSTPGFMTELGSVLKQSLDGSSPYSKQAAIDDVQGVLQVNARKAMEQAAPSIARVGRGSGLYGDTTTQLFENDFAARLAGELVAQQQAAIQSYGNLDNQRIGAFSGATSAGTTTESSGGSSQSSSGTQEQISLNAALGLQEALQQGTQQSQGSSSGFNLGLPSGKADGGRIPTDKENEDFQKQSILQMGTTPFNFMNEFFKFDGKGGRNSGLTILPQLLAYAGKAPATAQETIVETTPESAAPTEKKDKDELDNVMRISDAAMEFMKLNNLTGGLDAAISEIAKRTAQGTIYDMKDLDKLSNIKEFSTVAPAVMSLVYGHREPGAGAYADGGQISDGAGMFQNLIRMMAPQNIFDQTRQRREREAEQPQPQGAVIINVNTPTQQGQSSEPYGGFERPGGTLQRRENGGQITDSNNLLRSMQQYAATGRAPTLESRTTSRGVIAGPQSKSGRDNQIVAVGGGEGVIPQDVMEVEGVPELLQHLIQTYHTPVK